MPDTTRESAPLACVPGAIPASERSAHAALTHKLFAETVETRITIPSGYGYRFPEMTFEELSRFVVNERKCCPFLQFTIDVAPAGGPVWLRLTGPEGTREFLDAELPFEVEAGNV